MIKGFIKIPEFIKLYIDKNEPGIENITKDFCKLLIEEVEEPTIIREIDGKTFLEYNISKLYPVKRFCEFYISKSKLDAKLRCEYEEELNIPKSISNEIFTVELEDKKFATVYIDKVDSYVMTLEIL